MGFDFSGGSQKPSKEKHKENKPSKILKEHKQSEPEKKVYRKRTTSPKPIITTPIVPSAAIIPYAETTNKIGILSEAYSEQRRELIKQTKIIEEQGKELKQQQIELAKQNQRLEETKDRLNEIKHTSAHEEIDVADFTKWILHANITDYPNARWLINIIKKSHVAAIPQMLFLVEQYRKEKHV
jgi:hypothetical protein